MPKRAYRRSNADFEQYNKGRGKAVAWIRQHVSFEMDECLIWPFSRTRGYGMFGYLGNLLYAHRFMCELVNGPPPSIEHQAAHSCGNGHNGCVNPKHLSWKTRSGNNLDSWRHSPGARTKGPQGQLSPRQVLEIRRMKGTKTQAQLAAEFGLSEPSIRDVQLGRTYRRVRT